MSKTAFECGGGKSQIKSGVTAAWGMPLTYPGWPMAWGLTAGGWGRIAVMDHQLSQKRHPALSTSPRVKKGAATKINLLILRLWARLKRVRRTRAVAAAKPSETVSSPAERGFRLGPEHYESMMRVRMNH